jgi:hypothetical protein
LSPAERSPHPNLLPARGEKEGVSAARTLLFIRHRVAQRSGGGGPREAWWKGHAEVPFCSMRVVIAKAPSTTLLRKVVPLPRFAGQDELLRIGAVVAGLRRQG